MARILAIGVVLLLAAAPVSAFAQDADADLEESESVLTEEFILFPPDLWAPGAGNDGRQDVREVTLPPTPSGPATYVPYCSPGSPICP
jgi:hypothetical protein